MPTSKVRPAINGVIYKHLELIEQSGVTEERLHQIHTSGIFSDLLKAPHLDREEVRKAFGYPPPRKVFVYAEKTPVRIDEEAGRKTLMHYYPQFIGWPETAESQVTYFSLFKLEQKMSIEDAEAELAETHHRFPTPYELLGGIPFIAFQSRATALGTVHLGENGRRLTVTTEFAEPPGIQLFLNSNMPLQPGKYIYVPSESEEEARSRHTHETCGND